MHRPVLSLLVPLQVPLTPHRLHQGCVPASCMPLVTACSSHHLTVWVSEAHPAHRLQRACVLVVLFRMRPLCALHHCHVVQPVHYIEATATFVQKQVYRQLSTGACGPKSLATQRPRRCPSASLLQAALTHCRVSEICLQLNYMTTTISLSYLLRIMLIRL